jgi:hypothetical protein
MSLFVTTGRRQSFVLAYFTIHLIGKAKAGSALDALVDVDPDSSIARISQIECYTESVTMSLTIAARETVVEMIRVKETLVNTFGVTQWPFTAGSSVMGCSISFGFFPVAHHVVISFHSIFVVNLELFAGNPRPVQVFFRGCRLSVKTLHFRISV